MWHTYAIVWDGWTAWPSQGLDGSDGTRTKLDGLNKTHCILKDYMALPCSHGHEQAQMDYMEHECNYMDWIEHMAV